MRQDLGFESIQEIDFDDVFKGCSVYCEMIVMPEHARRNTVAACQAALTRRGVAALILGGNLFSKRVMEVATEFLFVAATAAVNDRLKNHKLRRTAFHIAGSSRWGGIKVNV